MENIEALHKILVVFHNLKKHDSHLIMLELGKFNPKINVVLNGFKKYMGFTIRNKLRFIDNVRFLSSSFLIKDGFKYLIQEFDNNILDLIKQKVFYHHVYISDSEIIKEKLPAK